MTRRWFNFKRQLFHILDQIVSFGAVDEQMNEMYVECVVSKKRPHTLAILDILVVSYKYGAFYIREKSMKKLILESCMSNFEKVRSLKELYLLEV